MKNPFKAKKQHTDDREQRITEVERKINAVLTEYDCHLEPAMQFAPGGIRQWIAIVPNEDTK